MYKLQLFLKNIIKKIFLYLTFPDNKELRVAVRKDLSNQILIPKPKFKRGDVVVTYLNGLPVTFQVAAVDWSVELKRWVYFDHYSLLSSCYDESKLELKKEKR